MILFLACVAPESTAPAAEAPGEPTLVVPERAALSTVLPGEVSTGALDLCVEGAGAVAWRVSAGDNLHADPAEGSTRAGACTTVSLAWTGSTDEPALLRAELVVHADGDTTVPVYGAVAEPELPAATWTVDEWGVWTVVALPSAPFPYGDAAYDDASVLVWRPLGWDDGPAVDVVTHFHGHNATLDEVLATQWLAEQAALSGRNAVLVVPQGPVEAADGDFGRLDQPGGHEALVRDAITLLFRDGWVGAPAFGGQVLTTHSGGYNAVANVIESGGLPVSAVHLFDALYGRDSTFEKFALDGGVLRSVYTDGGGTDENNRALRDRLEGEGVAVSASFEDEALASALVTIGYSEASHGGCVVEDRAYARLLVSSGLGRSSRAAPPLALVRADDQGLAYARLLPDPGEVADATVRVEASADGVDWSTVATLDDGFGSTGPSPFLRARGGELGALPSRAYGATGTAWLVVDAFDRVSGSYPHPTHDFAAQVGLALGEGFSTASNEAVVRGLVKLDDFARVIWLLGDESVDDITFSDDERRAIGGFLEGGGRLIVSGSEVGYATDDAWLAEVLHVAYVADDAGSSVAGGFTFGTQYPEDYPDVLAGADTIWRYDSGGAAAVGYEGRVVVVGFGVENIEPAQRPAALAELTGWLQ